MDREEFAKFLELPEEERFDTLLRLSGIKLRWWQRLHLSLMNKWWSSWRYSNQNMSAITLWESILKGRF